MNSESGAIYAGSELPGLLKAGDEAAFTAIYKLYSKPLLRKILRMVYDEDIVSVIRSSKQPVGCLL